MIDRALGFSAPESYYFQLYPVNLILLQEPIPSPESKFKFSIYKGMQKFDQNKIMTEANFINTNGTNVMPFRGCQLNFYLPNFNKNRKILFTLKLNEKDSNQEYELGGIDIDPAIFINQFQTNGQNRFQQKVQISQQYALEFQVYLQKSRFALEKVVKSFQGERTMKSPVRERKSPVVQRNSQLQEEKSPVQERQPVTQEFESVKKSNVKSRSKVQETFVQKEENQTPIQQKLSQKVQQKPAEKTRSAKKDLDIPENGNSKEKSQKSEAIASPLVRTKQMKRTSGRNETTIRASQRLSKEGGQQIIEAKKIDVDSWTNHLQLVVFTVIGILTIYWVMHPTNRA